ncbi:hypothetical protein CDAR_410681 [Caerostris darwini]|uniref:Uncharacterized protein n=1 Tax=Caerostris darwini TaxID=1538125 RepID=A0AAV4P252_9ARAC|nr:hypothetical protein CDAR_410681 [Caerostris darwini]
MGYVFKRHHPFHPKAFRNREKSVKEETSTEVVFAQPNRYSSKSKTISLAFLQNMLDLLFANERLSISLDIEFDGGERLQSRPNCGFKKRHGFIIGFNKDCWNATMLGFTT